MTIKEKAQAVVEEFWMFDDWMDKYAYLIELGKDLPVIDSQFKTNNHLISGCQSRVWLHAEEQEGQIVFTADSDAVITKGIVSLLIRILSNHTPKEILEADFSFLESIGLQEHLSPTRANGLASMIKQIQLYARAFQLKSNQL
ncbi:MAG: Fe-S metabolism protein SufE [Bacteroidetes bacterium GWF2_41_31]|nr:MAG: Fe-S metabolism protein SufE [Bacteroidetes bacterium GWF2_41_31]OFZ06976.1 MAG: Fe-S metabolism protein SufE [Bacteroidetes bacterium RIFOXYB12_FULL_41_6]PJB54862.1 MAG: Fe-S metabolism protein SufE [Bacteroidetes bacterium CG_4_9_14_3_um_filter_41_19]